MLLRQRRERPERGLEPWHLRYRYFLVLSRCYLVAIKCNDQIHSIIPIRISSTWKTPVLLSSIYHTFLPIFADVISSVNRLHCFLALTEKDGLGDWSPEKDFFLPLTFRQPVQKSSSKSRLNSEDDFCTGLRNVSRKQQSNHPDDRFHSRLRHPLSY